jgi:hypothetical protein
MPSRLSLFDASGTPRLHGLRAPSNILGEHIRSADCRIATVHPSGSPATSAWPLGARHPGRGLMPTAGGIPDIPPTETYVAAVLADLSIYAEQLANPVGSGFAQAEITAAESWLGTSGLKNPPWSRRAYVVHREVSGAPGCGRSIGKSPARPARDSSIAAITPIQPSCVRLPTAPAGGAGRSDVSDHILGCTCAQCVPLRSTARPST